MGTVITWLISFFLVVSTAFLAITSVTDNGSDQAQAIARADESVVEEIESSFKIVSINVGGGQTLVNVIITNDGKRSLGDFEDWTVRLRYDQIGGDPEIVFTVPYSASLGDDTWTDQSFWLDYSGADPEKINPGRLNPHEELEMRIQVDPKIENNTFVVVTITSPTGITESITLKA
jgi:hypothetical protein